MFAQRMTLARVFAAALLTILTAVAAQSEIPAGTRFVVEMRDKLDARKVRPGKKFDARTVEALVATDGRIIESGAKLKGRVAAVDDHHMTLRFEQLDTRRGWVPVVVTVTGVVGEKHVKGKTGREGEISAQGDRGRNAAIGAVVGTGVGAAVGAARGGGKGAAIGAGIGAGSGAIIGASTGGRDLVLYEGARIELQLDRPLYFNPRR
jgi:hypothetical protein